MAVQKPMNNPLEQEYYNKNLSNNGKEAEAKKKINTSQYINTKNETNKQKRTTPQQVNTQTQGRRRRSHSLSSDCSVTKLPEPCS